MPRFIGYTAALALVWLASSASAAPSAPCRIEVVEKGSGWPVPLVELRTTSEERFVSDNAGLIAFDLPECMGRETWFNVTGHGYGVPKDGFGERGVRFVPRPDETHRLEVTRETAARRLGRLTGAGLFAESQKLGQRLDWRESGIVGSDTAMVSAFGGKLLWVWGDTSVSSYPLGIFNASGATTALRPLASFEPPLALAYDYFRKPDGAPRGVLDVKNSGPVWASACVTLPDAGGREHLVCRYAKIERMLVETEIGLAEWDAATAAFKPYHALWKKTDSGGPAPLHPTGHPAFWQDAQGKRWLYCGEGLPNFRCPATLEAWNDPATWEKVERPGELVAAGGGEKVAIASGSIAWNPWRKRWVTVVQQRYGKPSPMGEVWYAEASAPAGPWGPAVKVLTHQNYTFYNVLLHPELTPGDKPILLFEGTYTAEFSDRPVPTARYNYNQMLYRLDLDDPALSPAQGR